MSLDFQPEPWQSIYSRCCQVNSLQSGDSIIKFGIINQIPVYFQAPCLLFPGTDSKAWRTWWKTTAKCLQREDTTYFWVTLPYVPLYSLLMSCHVLSWRTTDLGGSGSFYIQFLITQCLLLIHLHPKASWYGSWRMPYLTWPLESVQDLEAWQKELRASHAWMTRWPKAQSKNKNAVTVAGLEPRFGDMRNKWQASVSVVWCKQKVVFVEYPLYVMHFFLYH